MKAIETVSAEIARYRIVPLVAVDDSDSAGPLADAMQAGGLPVLEVAFRTDAAVAAIKTIAGSHPDMLLGAGTVLTIDNLRRARDAGAKFALAPGFNPSVVEAAIAMNFPFFPGVATPSDIEAAMSMGLTILKFFPAETSGGVAALKALSGPYGPAGARFLPTGGISMKNMCEYLALKTVIAVGGSWIAGREDIAAGNWDVIAFNCRQAVGILSEKEK